MPKWGRGPPKPPVRAAGAGPASGGGQRLRGIIAHFNPSRGVGYISVPERDGDVWFMAQALERSGVPSIEPGTAVWFTLRTLPDGRPSARDIELAEAAGADRDEFRSARWR
jgi:cold shock CspA family protein